MKSKLILCLALVLSGGFVLSRADETNAITSTNLSVAKIVNPQGTVDLPKLGQAIFREQSSNFSLQVPIGNRKNGEPMSNLSNLDLQVWLLKTDGTSIPQSDKSMVISMGSIFDYSTDDMFYEFQKVPVDELSGVVVSLNGKLYYHQIEMSDHEPSIAPPDGNLFQISPTNISQSPLSVQVADVDNYEHFTVFYKTDKVVSDKFLYARQELSDGDNVISTEPVAVIWTTNGAKFDFGGGNIWPFKFKIIEKQHRGETAMPGYSGYWFYLRDFVTNASLAANDDKLTKTSDGRMGNIKMPGLNAPLFFTEQPTQFTVQLIVASYRDDEKHALPKVDELHRQGWLLRSDGTSIPQLEKPDIIGISNAGFSDYRLIFKFQKKSTNEVAGIVVSVAGKLYCGKLSSVWDKP